MSSRLPVKKMCRPGRGAVLQVPVPNPGLRCLWVTWSILHIDFPCWKTGWEGVNDGKIRLKWAKRIFAIGCRYARFTIICLHWHLPLKIKPIYVNIPDMGSSYGSCFRNLIWLAQLCKVSIFCVEKTSIQFCIPSNQHDFQGNQLKVRKS